MNTRRNILLAVIYMVGFTIMTSCAKPPSTNTTSHKKIPTIKMLVIGGPKLKPNTGGSDRCNIEIGAKGCIEVDRGDTAEVTFGFTGFSAWHFTEFKICKGTETNKADGTLDCNLGIKERGDFEFTDDSDTKMYPSELGIVKLDEFSDSLRTFKLYDDNRVPQEYFYQVKACKPLGLTTECAVSDPPIRNK